MTPTPTNDRRDLFFGHPNSYGTLGYALRIRLRTRPVKPFVRIEHLAFDDAAGFLEAIAKASAGDSDFVAGVFFEPKLQVASVGHFCSEAPFVSDYGHRRIYYRSLPGGGTDYLLTPDYLWRWDTDWFWCSRSFGARHALVRSLLGRRRLGSRTWTPLMRINERWRIADRVARPRRRGREAVVQDTRRVRGRVRHGGVRGPQAPLRSALRAAGLYGKCVMRA